MTLKLYFRDWLKKKQLKSKPNLYYKCSELPIHFYNEVDAYGDFNYLKKNQNDKVNENDLHECWLGILDELIQISKNATAKNLIRKKIIFISLIRKLNVFEALKTCIDLKIEVAETLKFYRIKKEDIDKHIGLLKNKLNDLLPKENDSESKKTAENFEVSIVVLTEHGYNVDRFKMTVTTWAIALNRIEEKSKLNKNGARV